ncbi:UNVERIFIED_CONTAM: hypothetical protein HDU68_003260 [Siphonaria sp. JEL0065]|nr:hypothetical protein HDU68_003260 [Siphonaria sp. JEL0065]
MGNDGGSIPKRHELVTLKAKAEKPDKEQLTSVVWTTCALSKEALVHPVVVCALGRLFNKDKLIEFLVDRASFGEGGELVAGHIASLKDVLTLTLAPNPSFETSSTNTKGDAYEAFKPSQWLCPITLKEFGGRANTQFAASSPCGCVVAREAVKKVGGSSTECLVCGSQVDATLWLINPSDKLEIERMKVNVETLKIARAEVAAAKKAAKDSKRKRKDGDNVDGGSAPKSKKKLAPSTTGSSSTTSAARANISIPLPADLEAKTNSATLAVGHSAAIQSLYKKDKDKPKGNYLTMGTFNRYTSF